MDIKAYLDNFLTAKKLHFCIFITMLVTFTIVAMYRYSVFNLVSVGHDAAFHYYRFVSLSEAISNGKFPVYIDFKAIENYGYATNLFYSNFTFLPFAVLSKYTGNIVSYQIMLFTYTILTGLFTYLAVVKVFKDRLAAYISAIIFTFCSYRLLDNFERSAIAETITFTFLPLVFYGLHEIIRGNYKKWYILSIGLSLFILTHILSTILVSILIFLYIVLSIKHLKKEPIRIYYIFISFIITILLSSYYIFPFLEQIISDSFNFEDFINYPFSRTSSNYIFNVFFSIGREKIFLPIIGLTITLPLICRLFIKKKDDISKYIDYLAIAGLLLTLYTFDFLPKFLYNDFIFTRIQYLFRFYEFASFILAVAGAYYLSKIIKSNIKNIIILPIYLFLILTTIFINSWDIFKYAKYGIVNLPERSLSNNYFLGFADNLEYLPLTTTLSFLEKRGNTIQKNNRETSITDFKKAKGKTTFDINLSNKDVVELPITYYKGYTAKLNDIDIELSKSKNGLVEIHANQTGKIIVEFTGTFLQKNSFYLTLASYILLLIFAIIQNRKIRRC